MQPTIDPHEREHVLPRTGVCWCGFKHYDLKKSFRPMLGISMDRVTNIRFPVLATPKIDGIRCITSLGPVPEHHRSIPVCRSLKMVPNDHVRDLVALCPPGLDGEILSYDSDGKSHNFNACQSAIMRRTGEPKFTFHVFDHMLAALELLPTPPYRERMDYLKSLELPSFVEKLIPVEVPDMESLIKYEQECVEAGYEGVCWRNPDSPYKCGRSTPREQYLVKMKQFITEEDVVVGFEPRYHNANTATINELGYQERSSHQGNMVQLDELGALIMSRGYKIGTGFTGNERIQYWQNRESLIGQVVSFKYQKHGMLNVPRIPVFLGFRDRRDISPSDKLKGNFVARQFELPITEPNE